MTKFLGININIGTDGITFNQEDKVEAICDSLGMNHCRGATTPISDDSLLDRDTEKLCTTSEAIQYRSTVGSLLHIANMTRPDIQYAVNRLCRYVRNPSQNAILSLKNLVRYISRTKSATLSFPKSEKPTLLPPQIVAGGANYRRKAPQGVFLRQQFPNRMVVKETNDHRPEYLRSRIRSPHYTSRCRTVDQASLRRNLSSTHSSYKHRN